MTRRNFIAVVTLIGMVAMALSGVSGCTSSNPAHVVWTAEFEGATFPNAVTFTGDGTAVVVGGGKWGAMLQEPEPGWATVLDACTGQLRGRLTGQKDGIRCVAGVGSAGLVATAGFDGTLRFYDVTSPQSAKQTVPLDIGVIISLATSPDGRLLALGGYRGNQDNAGDAIVVWDLQQMKIMTRWKSDQVGITSLVFAPDSKSLIFGAMDGGLRIWDMYAEQVRAIIKPTGLAALAWPEAISVSADGKMLAVARNLTFQMNPGQVELWDLASRKLRATLPDFTCPVRAVKFSPRDRLLVTGGEPAKLWRDDNGWADVVLPANSDAITAIAFSRDGRFFALASKTRVTLWEWNRLDNY